MGITDILSKKKNNEKELPLPQEIIDSIPNVNCDPELIEIISKLSKFEKLLKEKRQELSITGSSDGFGRFTAKFDKVKDGDFLIENVDEIENLEGEHPENRRADLLRQTAAIEAAISKLTEKKKTRYYDTISEACQSLPPEVEQPFRDILLTARQLDETIKRAVEVDSILNKKGIKHGHRPTEMTVIPYWYGIAFGGPGLPAISFIVENQQKIWDARDEIKEALK